MPKLTDPIRGGETFRQKPEHALIVRSYNDAQAECCCGKWTLTCTGERTIEQIRTHYRTHLAGCKARKKKERPFEAACRIIHAIAPDLRTESIANGRPFEVLDVLLNGKDKAGVYNVTFPRAPHAEKFLDAAKAQGFTAYGYRSIKRVGQNWVRTKTFRTVVIQVQP